MILELKGIYKEYQQGKMKVPVLKDVNFSMEEGEYVAIMGPSGSGKTTLITLSDVWTSRQRGLFFWMEWILRRVRRMKCQISG